MFLQFIGVAEICNKYITWGWQEIRPYDLDIRVVVGVISKRQLN